MIIAKNLDDLGVNVIEAGSAISSKGEIEAIKMIARSKLKAEICSFARTMKADIDAVIQSEANSVHLVVPTSNIHLKYKLKKTKDEVMDMMIKNASHNSSLVMPPIPPERPSTTCHI